MKAKTRHAIDRVKEAIRHPYAWPGGYELVAVTSDGALLCTDCLKSEFASVVDSIRNGIDDGWRVVGLGYEAIDAGTAGECGPDLVCICDHCGREFGEIESCAPFGKERVERQPRGAAR